jgi:tellurite resistance protein TerC
MATYLAFGLTSDVHADMQYLKTWSHTLETVILNEIKQEPKDDGYTLFRYEDWPAWAAFTSFFLALLIFDNVVLNRNPEALTVRRATIYTLFWVVVAGGFAGWVSWWFSPAAAAMWWSGYMLEWMLSFDNLFVFHLVFTSYACPNYLKHRPLFYGIVGAVIMRLVFIFIGEYLMHAMAYMHLVFGGFLIYTGIQALVADEDDEDPSQQPLVLWLQEYVKFVNVYDSKGAFFVKCPVDENGDVAIPDSAVVQRVDEETTENTGLLADGAERGTACTVDVVDFSRIKSSERTETRATMTFLVCVCLNICDLIFAVDSVSAIVAAVNDLFLAYTSAVFAMLGMRAIFFLIDVLVQLFSLLKYGVSFILVFIGLKLILGHFYHIPSSIVCLVLIGAIGGSIIASVMQEKIYSNDGKTAPEIETRMSKVKWSPCPTPGVSRQASANVSRRPSTS